MRFKVDYYDIDAEMDAQTVQYFKKMVIEPAVEYLHGVLMVRQRSGDSGSDSHLQLGYSCPSYYVTSGKCSRLDTDRECSSSSVVLNRTYFGAASTFSLEGGRWVETIEPAGGPGAPDADFVLAISASTTGSCGGGTLAFASTCLRDDIDRPVAGRYNQCPGKVSLEASELRSMQQTALHEILHAIGFSSQNFIYFRDPDTLDPYTPRNTARPSVLDRTANSVHVACAERSEQGLPEEMLQYSSERGNDPMCVNATMAGLKGIEACTQRVVIPSVRDKARQYFGCDAIAGPELENQESSCRLVGSHWEQRMFSGSTMSPTSTDWQTIDPVTLAMLEASGWYKGNYSALEADLWPGRDWASDVGCNAALYEAGIGGSPPASTRTNSSLRYGEELFCTDTSFTNRCSFDRRGIGICQIRTREVLDERYRYFGETEPPYKAGSRTRQEYLPHVAASRMCEDEGETRGQLDKEAGLFFGESSACFDATLKLSDSVFSSLGRVAGCHKYSCHWPGLDRTTDPVLEVLLHDRSGDVTSSVNCTAADNGQQKTAAGFVGSITCLHPRLLCRDVDDPRPEGGGGVGPAPGITASPTPSITGTPTGTPTGMLIPSATPSGTGVPTPSISASMGSSSSATPSASTSASTTTSPNAAASSSSSPPTPAVGSPSTSPSSSASPQQQQQQQQSPSPSPSGAGAVPPSDSPTASASTSSDTAVQPTQAAATSDSSATAQPSAVDAAQSPGPSPAPSTSAQPLAFPQSRDDDAVAPALRAEDLEAEYCEGTTEGLLSARWTRVVGAQLQVQLDASTELDLDCSIAPAFAAAAADVLSVAQGRISVAVFALETSGSGKDQTDTQMQAARRLQSAGSSATVSIVVGVSSEQEQADVGEALLARIEDGSLEVAIEQEMQDRSSSGAPPVGLELELELGGSARAGGGGVVGQSGEGGAGSLAPGLFSGTLEVESPQTPGGGDSGDDDDDGAGAALYAGIAVAVVAVAAVGAGLAYYLGMCSGTAAREQGSKYIPSSSGPVSIQSSSQEANGGVHCHDDKEGIPGFQHQRGSDSIVENPLRESVRNMV